MQTRAEILGILQNIEWAGYCYDSSMQGRNRRTKFVQDVCPQCLQEEEDGHTSDCELNSLIQNIKES